MSGSFPTSPKASSVKISSYSPTFVSTSHSLKEQRRRRGPHRWVLELAFPPMTRDEFAPIYAFAVSQRGQYDTFTYSPPVVGTSRITGVTAGSVNGAHTAGDTTISTDGWAALTACLKSGDFLKFSGHDKVYMVVSNVTSNSGGAATVTIEPPLKSDLADGEALDATDVPFTVRFDSDSSTFNLGTTNLYGFSVNLIEVV